MSKRKRKKTQYPILYSCVVDGEMNCPCKDCQKSRECEDDFWLTEGPQGLRFGFDPNLVSDAHPEVRFKKRIVYVDDPQGDEYSSSWASCQGKDHCGGDVHFDPDQEAEELAWLLEDEGFEVFIRVKPRNMGTQNR